METSFYDILQCRIDSPTEEIRKRYQQLILEHHPDKNTASVGSDSDRFIEINKAWKVLRDQNLRTAYDAQLRMNKSKNELLIYGTYDTSELDKIEDGYTMTCRCGGDYIISESEIYELEKCYIQCDQCSFHILVVQSKS